MNIKEKILSRVKYNIKKYNMINKKDTVCIGLSGGADSVCLFYCLYLLQDEFDFKLIAAHINHGIRKEAKKDALFCKNLCKKYNIDFFLKEVDIKTLAKENHLGEEEMGRAVRYNFFNSLCKNGKIATAHNKNDNVETIFMRLIRGTGLNGLGGIPFTNNNIIRPLLNISRKDIEAFVDFCNLEYVTDATNLKPIYTRNKIRLDILPYIEKNINKNVINTIGDNIESYYEDADCLSLISNNAFSRISEIKNNKIYIEILDLKNEHIAIRKRIIIKALTLIKDDFKDIASSKNIEDILELLDKSSGKSFKFKNVFCYIENNYLVIEKNEEVKNKALELVSEKCVMKSEIINDETTCYIPLENYSDNIILRERKEGDIVRIDDTSHKKLTKLLSDKKVPLNLRKDIKVVELNGEIIMIPGIFSTRYKKRLGEFVKLTVLA